MVIVQASNKTLEGFSGVIEDETMHTFVIAGKRVQKQGCVFNIDNQTFIGRALVQRPEERRKKWK